MRLVIIRGMAIALLSCFPLLIWFVWKEQRKSGEAVQISPISDVKYANAPVNPMNLYDTEGDWTNQDAQLVQFQKFRGKPALVGFLYTTCVDTCSLMTLQMKEVESWMPQEWRGKLQFLSVSIDPEKDTPKALHAYAERFEALTEDWDFLVGNENMLKPLAEKFSFYYKKEGNAFLHSDMLAIVDKNGDLTHQFWGRYTLENIVDALKTLEKKDLL